MDKLSYNHRLRAYIKRAGFAQTVVAQKLRLTSAQFKSWVREINNVADIAIMLADLLSLTEKERTELFSLANITVIVSPKRTDEPQEEEKLWGGRPPDEDNNWAFEQVSKFFRPRHEVYQEWLRRRREHGNLSQLADPYDSFKKALQKRGKKRKKGINPLF